MTPIGRAAQRLVPLMKDEASALKVAKILKDFAAETEAERLRMSEGAREMGGSLPPMSS